MAPRMNNISWKGALSAVLAGTMISLSGCSMGTSSLYEEMPSDYSLVYDVDGAQFAIPGRFISVATAVTEIREDSDFDSSWTYLYKDGEDQYILFSMDQIVIACAKNTHFDFDEAEDKTAALDNSSVMGIWTSSVKKKKLDYTDSGDASTEYKIIANTTAEVALTTNLYGDFVGKLSSIKSGDTEWTLFAGVPGESMNDIPKEQLSVINSIAKSLTTGNADIQEVTYEYSVGKADTEEDEAQDTAGSAATEAAGDAGDKYKKTEPEADSEAATEADETSKSEDGESGSAEETPKQDADDQSESSDTEDENTDSFAENDQGSTGSSENETEDADSSDSASQSEDTDADESLNGSTGQDSGETENNAKQDNEDESSAEADSEAAEKPESKKDSSSKTITVSNQKKEKADVATGAKASSIYSLLSIGEKGSLDAYSDTNRTNEKAVVTLVKTLEGSDAESLITKYADSHDSAPVGTQWAVAVYRADFTGLEDEPYIDVQFLGVDGGKLRHAGIAYPSRTYDMDADEDGNMMVYYAVPYNCTEYVLSFGEGSISNDKAAAYYHIN